MVFFSVHDNAMWLDRIKLIGKVLLEWDSMYCFQSVKNQHTFLIKGEPP